ncbi:ABC transporter permease [Aeromicrobium sp. CTD01-1L150]|uniref:ABC transporter permease n=1 Tax=Aeromicrobium sp. CTD01-1L150 TaxID=3341830 RepID=UPI0035BFEEFA
MLALLVVWGAASAWIGPDILPGPVAVSERLINVVLYEDFVRHMAATIARVMTGLVASLSIATVLGIAMGLSRNAERFLDGLILLGRVMPGLAWALLALMVVGVSGRAPIFAVLLAVTPLLTLQIWEATKALDSDLFRMARVFDATRMMVFRQVVVPATLPSIVGGAKLGLTLSWKVVVLAELFGVTSGVGAEINRNFQIFSLDGVLAWALAFGAVMALVEYAIIGPIYSRLTRWRSLSGRVPLAERLLRQASWSRSVRDSRVEGPVA